MERKVLSAIIQDRESYDDVCHYLDDKDFSDIGQIVYSLIADYYRTDPKAVSIDVQLLEQRVEREYPKHSKPILAALEGLSETSSVNVKKELLELKRERASVDLAHALLANDKGLVNELLDHFHLLSNTIADVEGLYDDSTFIGEPVVNLTQSIDPANLVRVYPNLLNDRLGGGVPAGTHMLLYARPECIAKTQRVRVGGCATITVEELYNRVHKKGNWWLTKSTPYEIQSTDDEGNVFYNKVVDVTYSGTKEVYKVQTARGFSITVSAAHYMATPTGYTKLQDLAVGDCLITDRTEKQNRLKRKELITKLPYSPYKTKIVENKYEYNRVKEHRLAYDAGLNELTIEGFIYQLKTNPNHTLAFSDSSLDIHHINGDHTDNRFENLELITRAEHTAIHAADGSVGNGHKCDPDRIISIEYVGEEECYDVAMACPYHNLRVEGVYVHNSGKTATAMNMTCGFIKEGRKTLYIGNEDPYNMMILRAISRLSGMTREQIREDPDTAQELALAKGYENLIFVSLAPGNMGDIKRLLDRHEPECLVIDQLHNLSHKNSNKVEKLELLATDVRNATKERGLVSLSLTQAADSADGKAVLDMGDVYYSNTGIPGQTDVMIGLGFDEVLDRQDRRYMSLAKNKLTGDHNPFQVHLDKHLSKITSL